MPSAGAFCVLPVYGLTGLFIAIDDIRAHGKDERILITAFDQGLDFTYDFLKRLTK
jgi:acetylornithine deacetylase/succinyl-diaminopimelate desuccinylase-like protein